MNSATTARLLGYLHRVFDKDPDAYLALRIRYVKDFTWTISDGVLTLEYYPRPLLADGRWKANGVQIADGVDDFSTSVTTIDLSAYTLDGLAEHVAALPGFSIEYQATEGGHLSALTLLDGAGNQGASNGDHLYAYTSLLWAYVSSLSEEIGQAAEAIAEMVKQMSLRTAEGFWLDELGSYYKVPRMVGELDRLYGSRIVAETLRPKGNNVAIAQSIKDVTGMDATVSDAALLPVQANKFDGTWMFDGSRKFAGHDPHARHGLFDVLMQYDLLGDSTEVANLAAISEIVNRLRDAGTYLRQIGIEGASAITDSYDYQVTDSCSLSVKRQWKFDGSQRFDGTAVFGPTVISTEQLI